MPKTEKDIIRKLQKLGERVDLVRKAQQPARDHSFEPIKAIVQKKWAEKHEGRVDIVGVPYKAHDAAAPKNSGLIYVGMGKMPQVVEQPSPSTRKLQPRSVQTQKNSRARPGGSRKPKGKDSLTRSLPKGALGSHKPTQS